MDTSVPSRREFGQALAALAAVQFAPGAAQAQPDPAAVAADALTDMVRSRHGNLPLDQLRAIKASLYRKQYHAEQLRKVKLHNGDEPAFVFRADVP